MKPSDQRCRLCFSLCPTHTLTATRGPGSEAHLRRLLSNSLSRARRGLRRRQASQRALPWNATGRVARVTLGSRGLSACSFCSSSHTTAWLSWPAACDALQSPSPRLALHRCPVLWPVTHRSLYQISSSGRTALRKACSAMTCSEARDQSHAFTAAFFRLLIVATPEGSAGAGRWGRGGQPRLPRPYCPVRSDTAGNRLWTKASGFKLAFS